MSLELTRNQKLEALEELTQQKARYYPAFDLSRPLNNLYPFVDRGEWMDQEPIRKFVKEVLEQRKK